MIRKHLILPTLLLLTCLALFAQPGSQAQTIPQDTPVVYLPVIENNIPTPTEEPTRVPTPTPLSVGVEVKSSIGFIPPNSRFYRVHGEVINKTTSNAYRVRLRDAFRLEPRKDYQVVGEPVDAQSAQQLSVDDRYQFQWWALSLVQARPLGGDAGSKRGKKGADKGIDGVINFMDSAKGETQRVIIQVKSGHVSSRDIRDLAGTIWREKAAMGVFITLDNPSQSMMTEAATAGFYRSRLWGRDYPKLQILTITDLLAGAKVDMPTAYGTFQQAPKERTVEVAQGALFA